MISKLAVAHILLDKFHNLFPQLIEGPVLHDALKHKLTIVFHDI